MYRPWSRSGTLLKALSAASIAASWPGLLALPAAFYAPGLLLVPLATFAIAFGHGAVLGLPLYLALRRRGWANGWLAALAGACIGTMPILILTSLPDFDGSQANLADWPGEASGPLWLFGFLGLCGGLTFFAVASGDGAADA